MTSSAGSPVAARPPGAWPSDFVSRREDREAILILAHLEGMTPRSIHALARECGSAAASLDAVRRGDAGSEADRDRCRTIEAADVERALADCGARLVVPGDETYPERLLHLPDPPGWLFVRGDLRPDEEAAAVVGARSCSPYGREVAESLGAGVAAAGVTVVSGAARGVDAAAHRGALRVRGRTVAVLGSGIDIPYPRSHRSLLDDIARAGAVVSEYPPGMRAHPRRFPARNRIVAALARVVVVVEGAPGSGSLITAEFAQDLHRDVLAIPGPVTSELSAAPHELIRDGAGLARDARDVLDALSIRWGDTSDAVPAPLGEDERRVLDALAGAPQIVEQVAVRARLDARRTLRTLVALELQGLIGEEGGRYRRLPGPGRTPGSPRRSN